METVQGFRYVGKLFVVLLFALAAPIATHAATNIWEPAGALATPHGNGHTATLLRSGKVLVAGGSDTQWAEASAGLYDPNTNTWGAAETLTAARSDHTATLLPSGNVLVAGGISPDFVYLASAELYDPASSTWRQTASMAVARSGHTATLLPSGQVLVAGGYGVGGYAANSAELYDPGSNTWSLAGSLATARGYHTATLLLSGKLLVVGGSNNGGYLNDAELYDPGTNSWSPAGSFLYTREGHTATLLRSGQVLVVGGLNPVVGILGDVELYDPSTNAWTTHGNLPYSRYSHTATLLASGKVLVAGGWTGSDSADAELFDPPPSNSWSNAGSLAMGRSWHTATLLRSGKVLVVGGEGYDGTNYIVLASAERYVPDQVISVNISSPTLPTASAVAATPGSPALTITVTAPTNDTAMLSLADLTGHTLDSTYGTFSPDTLIGTAFTQNTDGTYTAMATYTPPSVPPVDSLVSMNIGVNQDSLYASQTITLGGPPILLFHGIFDNACSLTGPADKPNLYSAASQTSALDVLPINYGTPSDVCHTIRSCGADLSANDFTGSDILTCVESQIVGEAAHLRRLGYSYDTFDAIGHSMGSLVAANYEGSFGINNARRFQIGRLVSIGTPWNGSPLAQVVWDRKDELLALPTIGTPGGPLWTFISSAEEFIGSPVIPTVSEAMSAAGHPLAGGVEALIPTSWQLPVVQTDAVPILVGQVTGAAPSASAMENLENSLLQLVDPNIPLVTVDSLLGGISQHDLVVPLTSQTFSFGAPAKTYLPVPAVHAEIPFIATIDDVFYLNTELHTDCIFTNALDALQHAYACLPPSATLNPAAPSGTDPVADLTALTISGTQLDPTAVTISAPQPVSPFGSYLASVTGTAACTPQTTFAMDGTHVLQEATGATPSFTFLARPEATTPTTWMVVCTSGDYVATNVPFTVAPPTLQSLQLTPDSTEMEPGETIIVHATANFAEGSMDVTGDPNTTYSALGPQAYQGAGAYQATKNGIIFVTVSYGGQSAMVVIKVGDDEVFESGFE